MRTTLAILSLPLLALTACGDGSGTPQTIGSLAPPTGATVAGGGTATPKSYLDVAATTSFDGVGGFQSVSVKKTTASDGTTNLLTLYQGNASTVATPSGTITYNPRDGIFTVAIADAKAGVSRSVTFQDPIHRIDYAGARRPIGDVPNLPNFNYLEVDQTDGGSDFFFYERPGNTASYVSLAGFVHYSVATPEAPYQADHGALVMGTRTSTMQVPTSGTGRFEGDFLATMISSGSFDSPNSFGTYLQWINGSSTVDVDFAKSTLALSLSGLVGPTFRNGNPVDDQSVNIKSGTAFDASGTATLSNFNAGFTGKFLSAYFTNAGTRTSIDFTPISAGSSTAGASSIDGAFYGPNAVNVGGSFRVTGGVPDQRVDILGAFTGAKK